MIHFCVVIKVSLGTPDQVYIAPPGDQINPAGQQQPPTNDQKSNIGTGSTEIETKDPNDLDRRSTNVG